MNRYWRNISRYNFIDPEKKIQKGHQNKPQLVIASISIFQVACY